MTDLGQLPIGVIEGKKESEYLVNLLLALKFSIDGQRLKQNREKILTFGDSFFLNDRESILFQVLTVYLIKLTNMSSVEYQELKQGKPKPSQQVIDFIHEVFGDEIPRFIREELEEEAKRKGLEQGLEQGLEIRDRAFTLKTLEKFPDWSDAEVAGFVGVPEAYVRQLRRESAA